ncbi:MAG: FAD-dependent oxidoreductase, partial [Dehalococcoidia bacterium]
MVVHLGSLIARGKTPHEVLNTMLHQPRVHRLIKGAVPLEYSAHLIPEGGIEAIPKVYTDGMLVVGDAAGLCYTNGINLEGINLAMTSGAMAAETTLEALKAKDYSRQMLSLYKKKLDDSFVIKDMNTYKNAVEMMHIERLFQIYPHIVCSIFEKMYRVDGVPRDKMLKLIKKELLKNMKTGELVSDGIKIGRALL